MERHEIPVPSTEFDGNEEAMLAALYGVSNGTYNSYTLAWALNPDVQIGTDAAGKAFEETLATTERLIARGIVAGERTGAGNGVYFERLKLTSKGERKAIDSKNRTRSLVVVVKEIGRD